MGRLVVITTTLAMTAAVIPAITSPASGQSERPVSSQPDGLLSAVEQLNRGNSSGVEQLAP